MNNKIIVQKEKMLFPVKTIIGYDIKNNLYVYFNIVPVPDFPMKYYNQECFNDYYFCSIDGENIIFPKKSNCRSVFLLH